MTRAVRLLVLVTMILGGLGCTVDVDANPNRCAEDGTCPAGRRCVRPEGLGDDEPGFCVGGMDAGHDAGVAEDAGFDGGFDGGFDAGFDAGCDLSSPASCGSCGYRCPAAEPKCESDGAGGYRCTATCAVDECLGQCVDRSEDEANCGGCGIRCGEGEFCIEGVCLCGGAGGPECDDDPSSTCCGTVCVDIRDTNAHCGGCGRGCPGGATCTGGYCKCGAITDCRRSTCVPLTSTCL